MSEDLIRRQAAIEAFTCNGSVFTYGDKVCKAIVSRIMQLPSAQPERKKGKWIAVKVGNGDTRYTCSECGQSYEIDSREAWDFIYCPKCGMEGTP